MARVRKVADVEPRTGTAYPAPFAEGFDGRLKRALTGELGITQFGVNVTTLEPGARSSQRHWHREEDEVVYILEGELTLVTDEGRTRLTPGMAAGFPAGEANGLCLVNEGTAPATYLEIGSRCANELAVYPDIDLMAEKRDGVFVFRRKDGTPYE